MPEEIQAAEVTPTSTPAETPAAESQPVEQPGQAEAATPVETEVKTEEAASPSEIKPSETPEVKQESKPISRRSAQYRIQQLTRQVNELKQSKPAPQEGEENPAELPDVNELVNKAIEARLNPIITEHTKSADDAEINEVFSGDRASERSKYESKIRENWKLDQYKNVAASDLYKIVAFDDAVKAATTKAVEDYKKAQKEASENSSSGTSNNSSRTTTGEKSAWDLSEKEFDETVNKARSTSP